MSDSETSSSDDDVMPPPPPPLSTPPDSRRSSHAVAGTGDEVVVALEERRPRDSAAEAHQLAQALSQTDLYEEGDVVHRDSETIQEEPAAVVRHGSTASIPMYQDSSDDDFDDGERKTTSPADTDSIESGGSGRRKVSIAMDALGRKYDVFKLNRYGIKQRRFIVLDTYARAIRFYGKNEMVKSEFPFSDITEIVQVPVGDQEWDKRKVQIKFKTERRDYEIILETATDSNDFVSQCKELLAQNAVFAGRSRLSGLRSTSQLSVVTDDPPRGQADRNSPPTGPSSDTSSVDSPLATNPLFAEERSASFASGSGAYIPVNGEILLDSDDYLDYHVKKKNKWGIKQNRILVLNSVRRTLLLLDENRKFKKEIGLEHIIQVDIPKSSDSSRAIIIFSPSISQRPFSNYFADVFDRIHFCERMATMNHSIVFNDENDHVDSTYIERFSVLKLTKVKKKKRIVYLDSKNRIIRSLDIRKTCKDVRLDGGRLRKIEKSVIDRKAVRLIFSNRKNDWHFVFSDAAARERFVYRCRFIADDSNYDASCDEPIMQPEKVPAQPLSIFVGTWNVGDSAFPFSSMSDFIPPKEHDIYVIGLQECSKKEQWVAELRNHV